MLSRNLARLVVLPSALVVFASLAACGEQCVGEGCNTTGGGGSGTTTTTTTTTTTGGGGGGVTPPPGCAERIETRIAEVQGKLSQYSSADPPEMAASKATVSPDDTKYAGHYRDDLTTHPGCKPRDASDKTYAGKGFLNAENEVAVAPGVGVQGTDASKPGYVPGYPCAAKEYTGGTIDKNKPIVILVHGNSSSPNSWEEYANSKLTDDDATQDGLQLTSFSGYTFTVDKTPREMLATKLVKQGYRVIAVDFRTDLTLTLKGAELTAGPDKAGYGDAIGNIDHGWAVPILQSLVKALIKDNPDQMISLVGHSLGTTTIQDALRRVYNEHKAGTFETNPFSRIRGVVLASGAVHGVNGGTKNCAYYTTMRGSVNCEMGDRDSYTETAFHKANNGPDDLWGVPCADGSYAFGAKDACGSNVVNWFTTTIKDPVGAALWDEFVSETASRINMDNYDVANKTVVAPECVVNNVNPETAFDSSGFFMDLAGLQGFLANHFGAVRSETGMTQIMQALAK